MLNYQRVMPAFLSETPARVSCEAQHARVVCMKSFSGRCDLLVDCLVGLLDVAFRDSHGKTMGFGPAKIRGWGATYS